MLNSFVTAYDLKNTYRANSVIYALKHTPLIKRILPYSLYKNKELKILANIISTSIELGSIFLGKIIYLLICIALIVPMYKNQTLAYTNIILFLTLVGGFTNTNIFDPSVDKYYAIVLMRFDAKRYILSNYIYFLLKTIVGFLPLTIIFGVIFKIPILVAFIIPLLVVNVKNIVNAYTLYSEKKTKKIRNENKFAPVVVISTLVLLTLAYGLPVLNIGVNTLIFYIIFLISIIPSIISFKYIINYDNYTKISKGLLKREDLVLVEKKKKINSESYKKQIVNTEIIESNKEGYAYFNDIFVQRHRKLLLTATRNISVVAIIIYLILIILSIINLNSLNKEFNNVLKNYLPYFLFVLYIINRGQRICQTMFMNCDHSMLAYRFYREPKAILSLFKERLKTLIKLNVIPGIIIATGTTILLYTTGGATLIEYLVTFTSIIAMSIFFSVHYLVLYYLLQPYDVNLEIKNPTFMIICGITYYVCYALTSAEMPTLIFGLSMCIFTIVYSTISLFLAYKYAPKRFKLRI